MYTLQGLGTIDWIYAVPSHGGCDSPQGVGELVNSLRGCDVPNRWPRQSRTTPSTRCLHDRTSAASPLPLALSPHGRRLPRVLRSASEAPPARRRAKQRRSILYSLEAVLWTVLLPQEYLVLHGVWAPSTPRHLNLDIFPQIGLLLVANALGARHGAVGRHRRCLQSGAAQRGGPVQVLR
ncbi:hypothetical protein FA95DRAFT_899391 [Auriscalpium vulgare]|uniref:Uncharacterized protein n=1 Tax=Auriscalpium vulgare TaxID=40419 RepID=A0ACB8R8T8_9AGAM|nr:hypothetical protein FA95DRAFT_899391 [Auriscalpium vulgare]